MIPREPQTTLLIPVPEAEPLVAEWRARYDPSAAAGVPAHVTLLYPFLPPEKADESIVSELRSLLGPRSRFEFSLAKSGWLAEEIVRILYLAPDPPEPFARLTDLLTSRFPDCVPYGGFFADLVPHLSVAHASADPPDELEAVLNSALPIACVADEAWLMEKPQDGRWALRERFAFGGGA